MKELVGRNRDNQILAWEKQLAQISLPLLQTRLDDAEKSGAVSFADFSDLEMVQWYLYRQEHLNKEHDKSPRTILAYERELKQFVEYLLEFSAEIDIDIEQIIEFSLFKSLSARHMRRYQEWLATRSPYVQAKGYYSAATLARKTTIIKCFLKFLYEEKYIKVPIHLGFKKANVHKDDRPNRDLGPVEVVQMLNHFREIKNPIAFAIIHVLTITGMRNEEFCKLRIKDIQYDSITSSYFIDVIGKGNKRRQIPIKEKGMNSIRMFRYARGLDTIEEAAEDSPLFATNTGRAYSPSYLSQYLTKTIMESELPFLKNRSTTLGPHTLRHSFAIISHINGADLYTVMMSLGHEQYATTQIYMEKVLEKERHAIHSWKPEVFGDYI